METNHGTGTVMVPMTEVEEAIRSVFREQEKRKRNDTGRANPELGAELMRFRRWMTVGRQSLADEAGVSVSTVQKIETGVRGMSFETYIKLCNAFQTLVPGGDAVCELHQNVMEVYRG